MTPGIKDKILYLRLKDKDKEAFIKTYELYVDHIYRFIYFKVSNAEEAEDLTSQVFLKVWDYVQNRQVVEHKNLKALLYKSARNLVIDHYRSLKTRQNVSFENELGEQDVVDKSQDIHRQAEIVSEMDNIEKMMLELKDEYKEIIILRFINELEISEIAQILNKNKGNVRVLIHRAIKALRDIHQQDKKIL